MICHFPKGHIMKRFQSLLITIATLLLMAGCGGGGESLSRDDTGTNNPTTPVNTSFNLTLAFTNSAGEASSEVSEGNPLIATATVTNQDGVAQNGIVVTFLLSIDDLAEFNNDTGTALTNAQGEAVIELSVGSLSGSGTLTASIENGSQVVKGFESAGTKQQTPVDLELFASAVQLASSGGDDVELIAVVKNEQNILLPGVSVSFSADEGASLSNIDAATGDDGTARATLSTQNNKRNRDITVTASTATLSQELTIKVVGTEINVNGPSSIIINDSAPITFVLSDSDGNGIPNQTINLSTTIGQLEQTEAKTGPSGQVTVLYTSDVSGKAEITASALNTTNSPFFIDVQQDDFSFTNLPDASDEDDGLSLNTLHELEITWLKDNLAFESGLITVSSSRGDISVGGVVGVDEVLTDANGKATFSISSEYAGPASISAVGVDNEGNEVTARAEIEFVAETVDSIFVDATPDFIGPEGQTSTITAVVRDEIGNLVKDQTVNFSLTADSSGGQISPNTATTDSNGIASTVYTSNSVSGDNGVTINASAGGVNGSSTLTVGDRAFDISLGTGSTIQSPDNSTYLKEFAVFVTDASGRPVKDAELSASITSPADSAFYTGFWVWNDDADIYVTISGGDTPTRSPGCANEDVNRDGLLDATTEDTNQDGLLTPGNVASVSFKDNISRTNEFGQATVEIRYPRQFGHWTRVTLSVFGQSSGSESSQFQVFTLPVAADDLTDEASPPPNSPFGTTPVCPVRS